MESLIFFTIITTALITSGLWIIGLMIFNVKDALIDPNSTVHTSGQLHELVTKRTDEVLEMKEIIEVAEQAAELESDKPKRINKRLKKLIK